MATHWAILAILIFWTSCQQFVALTDGSPSRPTLNERPNSSYSEKPLLKTTIDLKIAFTHNIEGETHPCGCPKFPKGGLARTRALLTQESDSGPLYFIDGGDTFFKGNFIPPHKKIKDQKNASFLARALKKMNLKAWVPGEQDFANSPQFLFELLRKYRIPLNVINLRDSVAKQNRLPVNREGILLKNKSITIRLIGIVDPNTLGPYSGLFENPKPILEKVIKKASKNEILIVHSSGGLEFDTQLAKNFSRIDWIIGGRSQSFLTKPKVVGRTRIVQALSRNHYIGVLSFSQNGSNYRLIPTDESLEPYVKPDLFYQELSDHLKFLQTSEVSLPNQSAIHFKSSSESSKLRFRSGNQCAQCHQKQFDFWTGTPHAHSLVSLSLKNNHKRSECLKCHAWTTLDKTLDWNSPSTKKALAQIHQNYTQEFSARQTPSGKLKKLFTQNNSLVDSIGSGLRVSCLHCHRVSNSHPQVKESLNRSNQSTCLSCHTATESSDWYQGKKLDQNLFNKNFHKTKCPSS